MRLVALGDFNHPVRKMLYSYMDTLVGSNNMTERILEMKILAFYLPQFHRTKENDEWWGEGFTDWTTVKKAKPLFQEHNQPRVPWKYYDLLEKQTMEEQAQLMHQFGVDGMCFYHYYFENGRKILEKPAENLLQWKDIDMPFCFYWANESWARTWSNVRNANIWANTVTQNAKQDGDGILLRQTYGDRKQWKEHFNYLLPFFKDKRYIRRNGRPVFIIYKPEDIVDLSDMTAYWNVLMEEQGLPHIFFIGRNTYDNTLDGYLDHEPRLSSDGSKIFNNEYGVKFVAEYDQIWKEILQRQEIGKQYFYGGFVGYDDTPRQGTSGNVIVGQTPQKFKKYMICLLTKAYQSNCDMVFLNAWNEWGEGMYLEPDTEFGTAYLQALKEAKEFVNENAEILCTILSCCECSEVRENDEMLQLTAMNKRYRGYWQILSDWINLNEDGKTITQYLKDNHMHKVAIYGMGMLGTLLYKELSKNNIEVVYCIDQDRTKADKFDVPVFSLNDDLQPVDLIIVTVDYAYESIKSKLREKGKFNIIALKELVEYTLKLS